MNTNQQQIDDAAERCNRARSNGAWDTTLVPEYRSGYETWLRDCAILADAYLASRQWQDEPDEDGPYWVDDPTLDEPHWVEKAHDGNWYVYEPDEICLLAGRRVCKIVKPMEPKR